MGMTLVNTITTTFVHFKSMFIIALLGSRSISDIGQRQIRCRSASWQTIFRLIFSVNPCYINHIDPLCRTLKEVQYSRCKGKKMTDGGCTSTYYQNQPYVYFRRWGKRARGASPADIVPQPHAE